jgi:alkylated DNA repair dioxygenase AlkB
MPDGSIKRKADNPPTSKPGKRSRTSNSRADYPQVTRSDVVEHRLPLQDADVCYLADFLTREEAAAAYEALKDLDAFHRPQLKVYGKTIQQSRSIAAYASEPFELKYSGAVIELRTEYPQVLKDMQAKVEERLGVTFNHCMLNKYGQPFPGCDRQGSPCADDGSVHIGKHRDNKENKVIASLSLGAERDFILTHDAHTKGRDEVDGLLRKTRFPLKNGSLLVMQGETQDHWKHEIVRPGILIVPALTFGPSAQTDQDQARADIAHVSTNGVRLSAITPGDRSLPTARRITAPKPSSTATTTCRACRPPRPASQPTRRRPGWSRRAAGRFERAS